MCYMYSLCIMIHGSKVTPQPRRHAHTMIWATTHSISHYQSRDFTAHRSGRIRVQQTANAHQQHNIIHCFLVVYIYCVQMLL